MLLRRRRAIGQRAAKGDPELAPVDAQQHGQPDQTQRNIGCSPERQASPAEAVEEVLLLRLEGLTGLEQAHEAL